MIKTKSVKTKGVEVNSAIIPEVPEKSQPLEVEAVVYNGNQEVRRYSLANHGETFVKLAEEFASKRKFSVRFEEIKQGIKCPSCGHVF